MSAAVTPDRPEPVPGGSAGRLRALLDSIRALTGDDAYERYLQRHQATHPEQAVLSPAEFYAAEIERRYSGVTRCC